VLARILPILFLCLLVGCEPAVDQRSYRHALDGAPGSLDPAQASNVYAAAVVVNLYDTLYRYRYLARPYELTSNLAKDLPDVSSDGRTYTFRLRSDARFIDDPAFAGGQGRPVLASDVVYSIQRHFDPATRSRGAWLWRGRIEGLDDWAEQGADYDQPVSGLAALDDHTLQIRLTAPYPQFVYTLATALSAIVPREAVEHYGREFGIRPVGSGPYQLLSLDETRAILQRHADFDRGPLDLLAEGFDSDRHGHLGIEHLDGRHYPFVDRVEMHFITEPSARWSAFATGNEVHNVMLPNEQASRLLASRQPLRFRPEIEQRYQYLAEPEAGFVFFGFNMANPAIGHHPEPTQDAANRELRCIIRDAYDWQARNDTFHFGLGQVFSGVIPPFLATHDPDGAPSASGVDPASLQDRLIRAGWQAATLPRLSYGLEASIHQRQIFEQFQSQMTAAGLPGEMFEPRSFATFADLSRAVAARQLDIYMMSWTLAYPDAQYALQLFYGPNASPGANKSNYANPRFDELFEAAASLEHSPERTALYQQMNRLVHDDCVVISGLSRTRLHLWQRSARMLPDREMLGGSFIRFVDLVDEP
jgi:oligopeptide transport system substrate-binding protein